MKGLVFVSFDLWCDWSGNPPAYRLYLDGELLTERNYIWNNPRQIIQERIPANLTEGKHYLTLENLNTSSSTFHIRNFRINEGDHVLYRSEDGQFVLKHTDLN